MADISKLPPLPVGTPPGSVYFNDWYEKLRNLVNTINTQVASITSNVSWTIITGKPTTIAGYGITDAQVSTQRNIASGYAGLNSVSRIIKGVDATDDLVIDLATKGLVLKDTQATPHYWRLTVSNAGALVITDAGTTKP